MAKTNKKRQMTKKHDIRQVTKTYVKGRQRQMTKCVTIRIPCMYFDRAPMYFEKQHVGILRPYIL